MSRGGPGGAATGAIVPVALEAAVTLPAAFFAVTRTRSRCPTSAALSVYFGAVAPPMAGQFEPSGRPPSAPHRTHWYARAIGVAPAHVPPPAPNVWPWVGLPTIAGSRVFRGGAGAGAGAACTTAVGFEAAAREPASLEAVTRMRRRLPTSACVSR